MRRLSLLVGFVLVGAAGAFAAVLVATSAESAPPPPKGVVKVAEQNVGENGASRFADANSVITRAPSGSVTSPSRVGWRTPRQRPCTGES